MKLLVAYINRFAQVRAPARARPNNIIYLGVSNRLLGATFELDGVIRDPV